MAADEPIRGERVFTPGKPIATIDLVAQALRLARDSGGACLLLGAGASVSAGIPAAAGLVERMRALFPETCRLAQQAAGNDAEPDYAFLFGRLSLGERARLVAETVAGARLNWEHLVVADLMARGFIGPVLTSNFDPLLLDACARAGLRPAVYDLSGGVELPAGAVAGGPTVVYLHGLGERVMALADAAARARHRRLIAPALRDLLYRGTPIVALGLGGAGDDLVDLLAGQGRFINRLFWASHFDHRLGDAALALLNAPDNDALLVPGYDAEGFVVALARKLDAFPPRFVADPYGETLRAWQTITPPGDAAAAAPFEAALSRLRREAAGEEAPSDSAAARQTAPGIEAVETRRTTPPPADSGAQDVPPPSGEVAHPAPPPAAAAGPRRARAPVSKMETPPRLRLVVGDYQRLIEDYAAGRLDDAESRDAVAWAYVMLANDDANQAQTLDGRKAGALWARASEKYAAALRIDPQHADALYNWAGTLATRAQAGAGAEARKLWAEAVERYEAALTLRPDDAEALGDCARALVGEARLSAASEAGPLVDRALAKLEQAYRLGDDTAYVGYLEVALAHARHKEIARFLESRPPKLAAPVRFALALVYLIFVLEHGQPADLAPFDELSRLDEPPCEDWDFGEIEPAVVRLPAREAGFVRAVIDVLQGDRALTDWPSIRDAWLAGGGIPQSPPTGVTALR
ncbi:MAG: hypothetical protein ACE5H8_06350 [Alphaproteobacteria bacterium]